MALAGAKKAVHEMEQVQRWNTVAAHAASKESTAEAAQQKADKTTP